MTKAELKTGMVVTFRNERKALVLKDYEMSLGVRNVLVHLDTRDYTELNSYRDDLTFKPLDCEAKDIVEIGVYHWTTDIVHKPNNIKTIWTREKPVKEMTVAEIEKALGYSIKVVK